MIIARTLVALVLVASCGSKDSKESGSSSSKSTDGEKAAPKEKQNVDAAFFGKAVAPPGALAKLTWGSSAADAQKAAPELFPKADKDTQFVRSTEHEGVSYGVGVDKESKKLSRMYLQLPAKA